MNNWTISKTNSIKIKLNLSWILYYDSLVHYVLSAKISWRTFKLYASLFNTTLSKLNYKTNTKLSVANSSLIRKPHLLVNSQRELKNCEPKFVMLKKVHKPFIHKQERLVKLFYIYLLYGFTVSKPEFTPHAEYRLMFLYHKVGAVHMINSNKFFARWHNSYQLFFNLFYADASVYLFGSKVFKTEVLAFNWSLRKLQYSLFKFAAPIFFMSDVKYGIPGKSIVRKWIRRTHPVAFILDLELFTKTKFFLMRAGVFTTGVIPATMAPWELHYPIPSLGSGLLVQYYFLKFISFVRQEARQLKLANTKNLWIRMMLKS